MGRPKGSKNKKTTEETGEKTTSKKRAAGKSASSSAKTGKSTSSAAGRGTSRAASGRSASKKKAEPFMGDEVTVICAFAFAVFMFLSNLGLCGPIGTVFRNVQLGLFGTMGFAFPVVLVAVVAFVVSNRDNPYATIKMTAALAVLIFVAGLIQLTVGGGADLDGLPAYFQQAAYTGIGGGVIGGALAQLLYSLTGTVGAVLILLAAILICLVYVTEKPLARMLAQSSIEAAGRAREDLSNLAEEARARAEERRQYRLEQRARGVDLGATDLSLASGNAADSADAYGGDAAQCEADGVRQLPYDDAADGFYDETGAAEYYDENGYPLDGGEAEPWTGGDQDGFDAPYNDADAQLYANDLMADRSRTDDAYSAGAEAMADSSAAQVSFARDGGQTDDDPYSRFTGRILPEDDTDAVFDTPDDIYIPDSMFDGPVSSGGASVSYDNDADSAGAYSDDEWEQIELGGGNAAVDAQTDDPDGSAYGYGRMQTEADSAGFDRTQNGTDGIAYGYAQEQTAGGSSAAALDSADTDEYTGDGIPAAGYDDAPGGSVGEESDEAAIHAMHEAGRDMFGQEAGTRRITTASGRVIESDVDDLHKRVERRRTEAATEEDNAAVQAEIAKKEIKTKPYRFPAVELLKRGGRQQQRSTEEIRETAIKLQQTLKSFGVGVTVTDVSVGPAVTRYELHPEQGVKVSRIVSLTDDIKLSLAASDIRIEAPIPGKSAVGIEVPNKENVMVYLGDVIGSPEFANAKSKLSFAVGKDIGGQTVVTDLAKMPHLLIAGATGSGKSVCINTIIMSLIYKSSPEEVRLIMIDPKVVELQVYNGIPHLLIPVVTDPKKASAALNWAVAEMTDRYKKFAELGVRDLKGYNARVEAVQKDESVPEDKKPQKLPQIVIIVDELADLMMVAPGEVEDAICRLAQLARAAGIHLVIATQRPSVNVITGLIKANVPSRIAFAVSSGVDSRTIIDMNGAEKLLGKGDMLFYPSGIPKPVRVQGAFVSDAEVQAVVDFLTKDGAATYSQELETRMSQAAGTGAQGGGDGQNDRDPLFHEAGMLIIEADKASIGMLQRKFRIGFNRAARIMDQLAEAQVVGPEEGTKPRRILMSMEEFNEI